jgi:G patch domain/KOW motif-containing protein
MTQYNVKLVGKKEYDKYSKYLNKGKTDKYKEEQEEQNGHGERKRDRGDRDEDKDREKSDKDRDRHRKHDESRDNDRKRKHRAEEGESRSDSHSKHHKTDYHRADASSPPSKSSSNKKSEDSRSFWLRKDLRVRVVDKNYKKGRYYKEKVVVVDVISLDNTVCKTDDGKVLDGLNGEQLETVIPKQENAYVMLCSGKHKGQLGKIVKRNKDACQALVQLLADRDRLVDVSFDDICEYVGNIDDEFDY